MRLPLYVLAVGGGTLVQGTVAPVAGIGGVVPDLPIVLVALLALRRGPEAGCLSGFALGLAQDVLTGSPLGLQALSKAMVGFAAGSLRRWCVVSNPLVPVTGALLATVGDGLLRFLLLQVFQFPAPLGAVVMGAILPQAGYNALLMAAILAVPGVRARA